MTLRRRLVSITVAVTAAVVICVGVVYGIWDFRQGLAEQRRHAQALLTALTPALTRLHATPGEATATGLVATTLDTFASARELRLDDGRGGPQMLYRRTAADPGDARIALPIALAGGGTATATLVLSGTSLRDWLTGYLGVIGALLPVSALLATILALRLQRRVTQPLRALTAQLQRVAAAPDFRLRVESSDDIEIGALCDGFNQMMARLAKTEVLLLQHKEAIDHAAIVSITDVRGTILYANAKFCEISRYARDELVGNNHRIVNSGFHPVAFFKEMWRSIANGAVWHGEICNRTKDGDYYWVDTTIVPFVDERGKPQQYLAIRFPITDRKRQEIELVAAKTTLETRVAERTRELMQSRERLVEAEKLAALGALVAGIAHEINTPVGIGVTASSHLADGVRELRAQIDANTLTRRQLSAFVETCEEGTAIVLGNLERAARLINSFKQVAADQSQHERRRFRLHDYIDEILLSLRPTLKRSQHQVDVDCPDDLEMDSYPGAIWQVLTNLVNNALRYAFADGEPGRITISAAYHDHGRVRLVFADDGRGIAAEDLRQIFQPFFTTGRHIGGTGLGLHIVHNLVHGTLLGEIHCDSTPGQGTRFELTLPLVAEAAITPEAAGATR